MTTRIPVTYSYPLSGQNAITVPSQIRKISLHLVRKELIFWQIRCLTPIYPIFWIFLAFSDCNTVSTDFLAPKSRFRVRSLFYGFRQTFELFYHKDVTNIVLCANINAFFKQPFSDLFITLFSKDKPFQNYAFRASQRNLHQNHVSASSSPNYYNRPSKNAMIASA